jgi:AraC-like DNA-binding protein
MILAFVVYLSHFLYFHEMHAAYVWLDVFYYFSSLSVYPAFFVYVLLLTRDERFSFSKHARFFVAPALVFVAIAAGYIVMDQVQQLDYISEVLYGGGNAEGIVKYMEVMQKIERLLFVLQIFFYGFLTFRELRVHKRELHERYSFTEQKSLTWVQVMNITFLLTMSASIILAVVGRERFLENSGMLLFPSVIFSAMLFVIGILGNIQKVAVLDNHDSFEVVATGDEKIPARLREEIIALFEKENIYLDKELTIWDLAGRLGTNRTYVSKIFNNEFGINFATFVNNHRVDHAKQIVARHKTASVDEIADLSGFGSVASLYRAFLSKERITLPQYRKTVRGNGNH